MENDSLKIIVEGNIPYFRGIFDSVADVRYLAPEDITPDAVKDADALVTRTRTKCSAELLDCSHVKMIASATIGLDHVDLPWCAAHGITVRNAPGCNAPAVAQYVFASLLHLGYAVKGKTLGIVGVGNVGKIVERFAAMLGVRVLRNDPPRALAEGSDGFCSLEEIARESDFITFHTPLVRTGNFPTVHLLDDDFVSSLKRKPVIINSARGPVTDTQAILRGLESGKIGASVIDCWECEPTISRELLERAAIATPHIAGYSSQGKKRASRMAAEAVASFFNLPLPAFEQLQYLPAKVTEEMIAASYNPLDDTRALREEPDAFERLRNTYSLRNETGAMA